MDNEYQTSNTSVAAFIGAYGIKPKRIERQGQKCVFTFDPQAQQFAAQYHANGLVPGKRYAEAHRSLMEMIAEFLTLPDFVVGEEPLQTIG